MKFLILIQVFGAILRSLGIVIDFNEIEESKSLMEFYQGLIDIRWFIAENT